jgi:hypothetical protein
MENKMKGCSEEKDRKGPSLECLNLGCRHKDTCAYVSVAPFGLRKTEDNDDEMNLMK